MWRCEPPPDPMELHGLRPLTWRDRLFWERLGLALATAGLWIALVLWLLSGLYDVGSGTVVVVIWIGLWCGANTMAVERDRQDIPRWPRRTD